MQVEHPPANLLRMVPVSLYLFDLLYLDDYDTTLQRLARQLAQLERATCPFVGDGLPRRGVHWVKPKLVAQIGFTEWTPAEKLRHPRFLGLRQDKRPKEVVREG